MASSQIFGSDKFDRYVGELSMQSEMQGAMGDEMDPGKLPFFGGNNQKQNKRVAKCALEVRPRAALAAAQSPGRVRCSVFTCMSNALFPARRP